MAIPFDDMQDLRILIQKLARRIRAERGEDMADGKLSVLFQLDEHGVSTLRALAERERVTPPSMNRTINSLRAAGYVARTQSTEDARKVQIALTESGLELLRETRRRREAWFSQRLQHLSEEKLQVLRQVTPILRELIES
jgi:DNA-binding MarR family transcriptional regulator